MMWNKIQAPINRYSRSSTLAIVPKQYRLVLWLSRFEFKYLVVFYLHLGLVGYLCRDFQ